MKKLRALFFGTPGLSATILSYLLENSEIIEIVGVVTNPDTTGGRGHGVISSSVAQLAREKGITLLQPEKIRDEDFLDVIEGLQPDICIVVAYGKILPQILLEIPPMGFLNVHTSLLPKYRGAAPIQHALLAGEKTTGLTIMQMSLGMDEGDILLQESWEITPEDTTGKLFEKTGQRGGPLLVEAIIGLCDKTLTPRPQDHATATYTKMIEKKDGELNPDWTIDEAYRAWQGFTPWPSLFILHNGVKISLLKVRPLLHTPIPSPSPIGEGLGERLQGDNNGFFIVDNLPALQLADGYILIERIHPAGKKPMSGEEFVRGYLQGQR